jgi:hypothetical protein
MATMHQFKLEYTKEELDFQVEEDEKISNLRKQILQKEENRKNYQRNILLKTIKKVRRKYIIKNLLKFLNFLIFYRILLAISRN